MSAWRSCLGMHQPDAEAPTWPFLGGVRAAVDAANLLRDLVVLSLRNPDCVVHRPRLDCQHEGPHLIAACGAFR